MFSDIVLEILLPILVFLLLRALLRSFFASLRTNTRPTFRPQQPPVQSGGVLKKDPVCGTYVSTDTAITRTVNGDLMYFCSRECAERFAATRD
jgi:YHS domain-containing protein